MVGKGVKLQEGCAGGVCSMYIICIHGWNRAVRVTVSSTDTLTWSRWSVCMCVCVCMYGVVYTCIGN